MTDKTLVIGAGGFVGRALLPAIAACEINVIAIGRTLASLQTRGVQIIDVPLQTPADLDSLLDGVGTVIHLASASTPGSSAGKPLLEMESNLRPTLALLEALQSRPHIHLVYVSSGGTLVHRQPLRNDEDQAVYTRSYHGAGKIAAEQFVEAWCHQFSGRATVLRPSNLYGPGQPERPGFGIVPAALGKIVREEQLEIWGDGSESRDFLYIDDFVQLCLAVLQAETPRGFRIFNACSGQNTSLNALLALIEQVVSRELKRSYHPSRKVDAPSTRLQAHRAHDAFGWAPQTPLAVGLEQTWRWFITTAH